MEKATDAFQHPNFAQQLSEVEAMLNNNPKDIFTGTPLLCRLDGSPIGKGKWRLFVANKHTGWRWLFKVRGLGLWYDLPIRVEINFYADSKIFLTVTDFLAEDPQVRYRSLLDGQEAILEFGYLPPEYYKMVDGTISCIT